MYTNDEITPLMAVEGLTNSSVLTADDTVSLVRKAQEMKLLREGTEIHWVSPSEVMIVLPVMGVRLASSVIETRDLIGGRGTRGVDGVVNVLSRVYRITTRMLTAFLQQAPR